MMLVYVKMKLKVDEHKGQSRGKRFRRMYMCVV